jgi:hypothetical protein
LSFSFLFSLSLFSLSLFSWSWWVSEFIRCQIDRTAIRKVDDNSNQL